MVEEQFRKMLYKRNFDEKIARYQEWATEADARITKEKDRLDGLHATPEQFHGPLDGSETKVAV